MNTDCNQFSFQFEPLGRREIVGKFDAPAITSDAGGLLLRELDQKFNLIGQFADCFDDFRDPELIKHSASELLAQRIFGIALGYEDLNDHDELRHDPVLGLLSDTLEPKRADCATLAGKSTLNRLEHGLKGKASRYHKLEVDETALEKVFLDIYVAAHKTPPKRIILDLDATDDPLHGNQEGRFYHGYYRGYCYLPLYIFDGRHLLVAKLRPANIDAAAGAKEEVARIVAHVRRDWPDVEIWLRADSGFARDDMMSWCEENRVEYVFGMARNKRLEPMIVDEVAQAKATYETTKKGARVFKELDYRTKNSWSKSRRVVAKAEHLEKGANPRFIVTSLGADKIEGQELYEKIYCARGEMENRIKECQLDLYADRTSAATMRANQIRLWFASLAYVLMEAVRRLGLHGTDMANATAGSIRLRLLKIGAVVTVSMRRIKIAFATACPAKDLLVTVVERLHALRREGPPIVVAA